MLRKGFWCLVMMMVLLIACSKSQEDQEQVVETLVAESYEAVGDSMIYGVACDGCSDSILVLLPDSGGDPVNYHILSARLARRMFGRPEIGDKMALMLNPDDPTEVLMAIDLEKVKGTWYYMEYPVLRHHRDSGAQTIVSQDPEEQARFDSIFNSLMVPREYSYTFKRDFTMSTAGGPPRSSSLDRQTPVEYPPMKRYMEWHVFNGKIIFTSGGIIRPETKDTVPLVNDTAEFVLLRRDTMALRFRDRIQGFLKQDSVVETGLSSASKR